jgi:hypothetical protein
MRSPLTVLALALLATTAHATPTTPADAPPVDALGRAVVDREGREVSFDDGPDAWPLGVLPAPDPRVSATCPAAARPDGPVLAPLPFQLEWYRPALDRPIGLQGLAVADLDGDGTREIVLSTGLDAWMILHKQGATYEQVWASLPMASPIEALRVARFGDETFVLIGHEDGSLDLVDAASHATFRTIATSATDFYGLSVANLDADPTPEAVFCDGDEIFRVDLESGVVTTQAMTCYDLAVGQIDDEPGLEIAVANDATPAYAIDAASGAVEWTNNLGFGSQVEVGDVDGDGRDEIVTGVYWYDGIRVWDGDTHSFGTTVSVFNLATIALANADADTALEILYGDAQWGSVHILDGATGQQQGLINNPEHGVTGIAVGDVDPGGPIEVVWGAGYSSSGADHLYVGDTASSTRKWESADLSGGYYGLGGGDLDDDGASEIYYASRTSNSGYAGGVHFVHDGATKALEQQGPSSPTTAIWRFATADATGSAAHELFTAGTYWAGYTGRLECTDVAGNPIWSALGDDGLSFRSMAFANVDADSDLELVASVGVEHTGAPGSFVYVYDATNGAFEWKTASMGMSSFPIFSLLRVANVDADPGLEAVVADRGHSAWIWDLTTHNYQQSTLDLGIVSVDTPDLDGDGTAEIVIGTDDGLIETVDPATGNPTLLHSVGTPVNSLVTHELTGDATLDFLFACSGFLEIRDGVDGLQRWSSGFLGAGAGLDDTVRVGDFDGDGETEILVSVARGVVMFGDDERDGTLLRDGFESGGLMKWVVAN